MGRRGANRPQLLGFLWRRPNMWRDRRGTRGASAPGTECVIGRSMQTKYGREFNQARKDQGFVSAEHLAAFFASYDHAESCPDCQGTGWYWNEGDAAWQPTSKRCAAWRVLDAAERAVSR